MAEPQSAAATLRSIQVTQAMSMQDARKPPILTIPLIFLLCAVAGSVDAIAYLLCGQIFVANMTGNTVLLGISLLQRNPKEAALRAGMVAAFLAGVIVARLLAGTADKRLTKTQRVFILCIESLLLLLLTSKNAGAHTDLLLLLLACMLGIQNAAFQYIGGFHLNTTFITGDLEKLGELMKSFSVSVANILGWGSVGCAAKARTEPE